LPVLFADIKEHDTMVCFLSDSDDHLLISAKLPILMDACFIVSFQEQSNESIQRRQKQNEWKKKQRLKEKRVTKRRQTKSSSNKKMRRTRAASNQG
jgi:hypothetical protein